MRRRRRGSGQVAGELHPQAKISEADVALARLIAADRTQPRGWIAEMAVALKITDVALISAIGGDTWAIITDPPPVPARQRHRWSGRAPGSRPACPTCAHAKYYAVHEGARCRDVFHTIDHRQFSSPINARKARLWQQH
jgi:hypothetical protein